MPAGVGHAQAKRTKLKALNFPKSDKLVYVAKKGWRQVPRTLSLVMTLIARLAPKGKQNGAGRVYLELWLRDMGGGFVELSDDEVHAFASGYTTSASGVRSWRDCMDVLVNLGFIKLAPKRSSKYGYALIVDPDSVVENLRKQKRVDDGWYNEYQQRAIQIGIR